MKAFFKKLKYTPFEIADALVLDLINFYEFISFYGLKIFGKYNFLKRNKILKNNHKDQRIFLLGNSPSLNNFDLKKLSNEIVIMVKPKTKRCFLFVFSAIGPMKLPNNANGS